MSRLDYLNAGRDKVEQARELIREAATAFGHCQDGKVVSVVCHADAGNVLDDLSRISSAAGREITVAVREAEVKAGSACVIPKRGPAYERDDAA